MHFHGKQSLVSVHCYSSSSDCRLHFSCIFTDEGSRLFPMLSYDTDDGADDSFSACQIFEGGHGLLVGHRHIRGPAASFTSEPSKARLFIVGKARAKRAHSAKFQQISGNLRMPHVARIPRFSQRSTHSHPAPRRPLARCFNHAKTGPFSWLKSRECAG